MVASTDIKFYVHTNTNAPQLTNNFGCMIDVLDACLVNGFGSQAVATLTASGTTVTATYSSAHNYLQYQVTKIADVNQTEFNGEHRILTVPDANTITFQLASTPSVTTATGTITSSLPSLGWEKPFSSTNVNGGGKAAYRSKNTLLPSRPFLRVVDELDPAYTATYAKYAKVGIVEDMTDIDTMIGVQAPYDAANPNKNWLGTGTGATAYNGWAKWHYASSITATSNPADSSTPTAGNRSWILIGNKDYFYILPTVVTADTQALTYGFGSFKSLLNADTANTFLSSTYLYTTTGINYPKGAFTGMCGTSGSQKTLLQRPYSQAASAQESLHISLGKTDTDIASGYSNYIGAFNLTNVAPFAPVFFNESVLRGEIPGFYWLFQVKPYTNYQLIEKNNGLYIAVNAAVNFNQQGQVVIKIGDL